ncbi:MAG: flagellar M-ring protein FliF, partial [Micavibrio aeruginosavorus]
MNSFLETLKQLGPARLAIMGSVLLGLMVFFIFVSLRVSSTEMNLLYSDLSSMDSGAMVAKLEEAQIPYEVSSDGTRIEVPDTEVGRARMLLAEAGLPNGGSLGYELFDKQSGFGTTNAVQNINALRALEGELSRTISTLEPVRSARVHLVLPQRELFARETRPASASVALGLRPGKRIEQEQVAAIQSLIASAVPELKMEQVSIIDQNGNLLARGGESAENQATMKAEELRLKNEQRLIQTIEDLVGRTVGYGKVRASVTAELNFDRTTTAEETYNP